MNTVNLFPLIGLRSRIMSILKYIKKIWKQSNISESMHFWEKCLTRRTGDEVGDFNAFFTDYSWAKIKTIYVGRFNHWPIVSKKLIFKIIIIIIWKMHCINKNISIFFYKFYKFYSNLILLVLITFWLYVISWNYILVLYIDFLKLNTHLWNIYYYHRNCCYLHERINKIIIKTVTVFDEIRN